MPKAVPTFQFATLDQQNDADLLGMWTFLATEVLFFGALIAAYFAYRIWHGAEFIAAARQTKLVIGVINTAVLLTSSGCMAMAVHSTEQRARKSTTWWLSATALLGLLFLVLKGYEYWGEYQERLVPALNFASDRYGHVAELFFVFYFCATGLHALHLLIGIVIVGSVVAMALSNRLPNAEPVRLIGLYWHFVDIVWIFLFPLIYLAGRS